MFNLNYVKGKRNSNDKISSGNGNGKLVNYVNNITKDINPFYISDLNLLFFDIFYKNNKLYLIMPIYNQPYTINNFLLTLNKVNLIPSSKYLKDSYEPISVFVYDINETRQTEQIEQHNNSNFVMGRAIKPSSSLSSS